jgi:hypothetical protein
MHTTDVTASCTEAALRNSSAEPTPSAFSLIHSPSTKKELASTIASLTRR